MRRSQAYEKLDKLEEALKGIEFARKFANIVETVDIDVRSVLEIDPTIRTAIEAERRLGPIVTERQEKLKAEMMDKLKGFGNTILGKFGLSTDNFKMVQDPATGSYSINFAQNK